MTRRKQLLGPGSFEIAPKDGLGHGLEWILSTLQPELYGEWLTYHIDICC